MVCTNPKVGPCVDQPIVGTGAITGMAVGAFPPQVQILAGGSAIPVTTVVGAKGAFTGVLDANQSLSVYDQIQVVDANNPSKPPIIGPVSVAAAGAPQSPACSASAPAGTLPCIKPIQLPTASISGFSVPGSVVEIDVAGVDKGNPSIKPDGSFTFDISSLSAGQTITAKLVSAGTGAQPQDGSAPTDAAQKAGGKSQKQSPAGDAPSDPQTASTNPSTTVPVSTPAASAASCSASTPHPCISPVDPAKGTIAGFADKGFTVAIDLGTVGKLMPPVNATDGSFTTTWSGLAAGAKITIQQTSPDGNTTGTLTATIAAPKISAPNSSCSATATLPCLNPIQTDDPVVSGFVAAPSTIEVDAGTADKTPVPISASSNAFSFGLSSVLPDEVITIKQTTPQNNTTVSASVVVKAAPAAAPGTNAPDSPSAIPASNAASENAPAAKSSAPPASSSSSTAQAGPSQAPAAPHTATVAAASPTTTGSSSSLYTLGLVGTNVTSTSTSGPQQQFYASFNLAAPIPFMGDKVCPASPENHPLEQRCWVWVNPMISSAPSAANSQLTSYSSSASLASGVGGQTLSQITQTFSLQGGFQYALNQPYWGRQFGFGTDWARSTISVIAGLGFSTPYASSVQNASEFQINYSLADQFNESTSGRETLGALYPELASALCSNGTNTNWGYSPTGMAPACTPSEQPPPTSGGASAGRYTNVAFVLDNRSRFDRDYFAGLRVQTFYFAGACKGDTKSDSEQSNQGDCKLVNTFPGTLDIRFGQDETVTGGYLRGIVMTLAGTYPVPYTQGAIRIFGAAYLRLHKNVNSPALALIPTNPLVAITDPSVVIQPTIATDQDYYRLGIGVDLIPLFTKWIAPASGANSQSSTSQTSPSQ
jgi:hypothetical protein